MECSAEGKNLLASVIVPVYRPDRLERCVDSVLGQSYQNWELILVDDGGPGEAGRLCDEYAARDSRVRVIHQENRGISAARNAGLDACRGDVLYFIDDDDFVHPELLRNTLDKLEREQADMVCFYASERHSGRRSGLMDWTYADPRWDTEKIRDRGLCFRLLMVWSKAYRRELWDSLRFPEGHAAEDVWITVPLWNRVHAVSVVPQILYEYDRSPHGSVTQSWDARQDGDACRAYTHCMEEGQRLGAGAERLGLYRLYAVRSAADGLINDRKHPVLSREERHRLQQVLQDFSIKEEEVSPILSNDLYVRILEKERDLLGDGFSMERKARLLRCAIQTCCMDCVKGELDGKERERLRDLVARWKGPMKEREKLLQWGIRHEFRFLLEKEGTRLLNKFLQT